MTDSQDHYVVAGVRLHAFVADWLTALESGGGQSRGLLEHARAAPDVHERYSYGATYVMANIASRATEATASDQELLLFAVLALYQDAGHPGSDPTVWEGETIHVRRAFAHVAELGDREAARRLRAEVLRQSVRGRPAEFEAMLQRSMNHDPARAAAHDQLMASIDSRSFRAAKLLDPRGDVDAELAALLSDDDHRT